MHSQTFIFLLHNEFWNNLLTWSAWLRINHFYIVNKLPELEVFLCFLIQTFTPSTITGFWKLLMLTFALVSSRYNTECNCVLAHVISLRLAFCRSFTFSVLWVYSSKCLIIHITPELQSCKDCWAFKWERFIYLFGLENLHLKWRMGSCHLLRNYWRFRSEFGWKEALFLLSSEGLTLDFAFCDDLVSYCTELC